MIQQAVPTRATKGGLLFLSSTAVIWLLLGLIGAGTFTACSEFNRALKSDSLEYKMAVAEKYYDKGSYDRAIPLLEELIMLKRGTAASERINYLHAKAHFLMKDYVMAAYYLENYARTFPTAQYTEECTFLNAYCYYKNSPAYELDQADTRTAIDQLQLFMVRYPTTILKDSCNTLIERLRIKLEVKSYHAAEQYFHMRNFQGASMAFKDFLRAYPNSDYREDAMMRVLRSDHQVAMNSVEKRKVERLQEAMRSYRNFADAYPQGVERDVADRLNEELKSELDRVTKE
ncbi:MAG: outer membrane protein assembly factor BamD [Flavobacteriales bacterium]|nr:outer membrane protein assembly factor BamD [Flavobacteriales bacterium]MCC6938126.1 outer membrane protein assembly factor BamD [Flavobacteriales bacterium]